MNARVIRFWVFCCGALTTVTLFGFGQDQGPVVQVSKPVMREVADYEDFIGRVEPAESVEIRSRSSGILTQITHPAGATVNKGDVLFELDPRPIQIDVTRAEAEARRAEARLRAAEADLARIKQLLATKAISQDELTRAESSRSEAEATLTAAKASIEQARLRLSETTITAPISGKLSHALISVGNLVTAEKTVLANLISIDPVHVVFDVDEKTVLHLQRQRKAGNLELGRQPIMMGLADENGFPHKGKLHAVDLRLDPKKGTQQWRAEFANKDQLLLPGQKIRVRITRTIGEKLPLIHVRQWGTGSRGPVIQVVNEKNELVNREIVLGATQDGLRVVRDGLKGTELVVVSSVAGNLSPGTNVRLMEVGMPTKAIPENPIADSSIFGKGGKAGKSTKSGKPVDPNKLFDFMSNGKDYINLSEQRFPPADLKLWVEQNGIKDGKITREMYLKYYEAKDDLKKQLLEKGK